MIPVKLLAHQVYQDSATVLTQVIYRAAVDMGRLKRIKNIVMTTDLNI